jgi:hypothetical protein
VTSLDDVAASPVTESVSDVSTDGDADDWPTATSMSSSSILSLSSSLSSLSGSEILASASLSAEKKSFQIKLFDDTERNFQKPDVGWEETDPSNICKHPYLTSVSTPSA